MRRETSLTEQLSTEDDYLKMYNGKSPYDWELSQKRTHKNTTHIELVTALFATIQKSMELYSISYLSLKPCTFAAQSCPPLSLLNGEFPSGKTGAPSLHQLVSSAGTPHAPQPSNAHLLSHFLHRDAFKAQKAQSQHQWDGLLAKWKHAEELHDGLIKVLNFPIIYKSKKMTMS